MRNNPNGKGRNGFPGTVSQSTSQKNTRCTCAGRILGAGAKVLVGGVSGRKLSQHCTFDGNSLVGCPLAV